MLTIIAAVVTLFFAPFSAQDCVSAKDMTIGQRALIHPGALLNLREQPSASADLLEQLPGGDEVTIMDGPVCAEGYMWWSVDYRGAGGWVVESLIAPLPVDIWELGCPNNPPTQFRPGDDALVIAPAGLNLRSEPSTGEELVKPLTANTKLHLIDGPLCRQGYMWWQVQTGEDTGWVIENLNGNYTVLRVVNNVPLLRETTVFQLAPIDERVLQCPDDEKRISTLAFSPDGQRTAFVCDLIFYEIVADGEPEQVFELTQGLAVENMAYIGDRLLLVTRSGQSEIIDLETGELYSEFVVEVMSQERTAINRLWPFIAVRGAVGIQIVEPYSGTVMTTLPTPGKVIDFRPNGRWLAVDGGARQFEIWDVATKSIVMTLEHAGGNDGQHIGSVAFAPNGRLIATHNCIDAPNEFMPPCYREQIILWDIETKAPRNTWEVISVEEETTRIHQLAFNHDGSLLGVIVNRKELRFYNQSGAFIGTLGDECWQFWFTPDGTQVACQTPDEIRFWQVQG